MIYFGTRLKELRKEKNLTQQELADKVDLVKGSISAYEKSLKYPSVEVLIKLCNYFNVSSDYLLGLSDEKEIKKYDLTEEQMELVTKMIIQFHQLNNK
jgi:transcriptional regulator with XRE-family HTH domain